MSNRVLGVGVIGCGMAGTEAYLPALAGLTNARVVAVCDAVEGRAREAAGRFGAEAWYTDYRGLIENEGVEAVCVCTPPLHHAEQAIAAAEAGKHVLLEKPMAITLEEADSVISAAERAGVKLMVGFQLRFNPALRRVKELIENAALGDMLFLWSSDFSPIGWEARLTRPWVGSRESGGGLMMESFIHYFDAYVWWIGGVDSVYSLVRTVIPGLTGEDNALVALRFGNGAFAHLVRSRSSDVRWAEWGVVGVRGGVRSSGGRVAVQIGSEPPLDIGVSGHQHPRFFGGLSDQVLKIKHFVECVLWDRRPIVSGAEGRAALEVAVAAIRSADTGQPVKLPLTG